MIEILLISSPLCVSTLLLLHELQMYCITSVFKKICISFSALGRCIFSTSEIIFYPSSPLLWYSPLSILGLCLYILQVLVMFIRKPFLAYWKWSECTFYIKFKLSYTSVTESLITLCWKNLRLHSSVSSMRTETKTLLSLYLPHLL